MSPYTREQQKAARVVPLVPWLQQHYPDHIMMVGHTPKWRAHDSIHFGDKNGWIQYSTGAHGNSIDFLVQFLGYTVPNAVLALLDGPTSPHPAQDNQEPSSTTNTAYQAPQRAADDRRVIAYLTQRRGIPYSLLRPLLQSGHIYQDTHGNVIFAAEGYAQIKGTGHTPYSGIATGSRTDGYWAISYGIGGPVYVTEGAIDALSLRVIQTQIRPHTAATYAAMGGVKDITLQAIQHDHPGREVVLAVDQDDAGDQFAGKHPSLRRIRPKGKLKDWNDQLKGG